MPRDDKGLPIKLDPSAKSASKTEPAFINPPPSSPVYYGFPVLDDVCVDGFKLGVISDFEAQESDWGDAFVVAPDDSRAGLVWEIREQPLFEEILKATPKRWGVYAVGFTRPMRNRDDARRNLESILPSLRERWELWKRRQQGPE